MHLRVGAQSRTGIIHIEGLALSPLPHYTAVAMDHPNWLPWNVRQIISDFRGVKPVFRVSPREDFVQDRNWDMQWMRSEVGGPLTYRWVGGSWVFRSGRPVWPQRSPEWAERQPARAE